MIVFECSSIKNTCDYISNKKFVSYHSWNQHSSRQSNSFNKTSSTTFVVTIKSTLVCIVIGWSMWVDFIHCCVFKRNYSRHRMTEYTENAKESLSPIHSLFTLNNLKYRLQYLSFSLSIPHFLSHLFSFLIPLNITHEGINIMRNVYETTSICRNLVVNFVL